MDDYRIDVERRALERSGDPFYNSSIDHAAVIVEKMFRHAQAEICIISSSLNGRVFCKEEVIDEVEGFLGNANHKVRVLLEDDFDTLSEGHAFLRAVNHHPLGCEIRRIPPTVAARTPYHFTLVDDDSYRFEPDKNEWVAVAAFGDKLGAQRLKEVFNAIWSVSVPVPQNSMQLTH